MLVAGIAGLLAESERETRARVYRTLDLVLNLDPVGDPPTLDLQLQLNGGPSRTAIELPVHTRHHVVSTPGDSSDSGTT